MNARGLGVLRWLALVPLVYGMGRYMHRGLLRLVLRAMEGHFSIWWAVSLQGALAALEAAILVLVAMRVAPTHETLVGRCLLGFFGLSMGVWAVLFAASLYPPFLLFVMLSAAALLSAFAAYRVANRWLAAHPKNLRPAD